LPGAESNKFDHQVEDILSGESESDEDGPEGAEDRISSSEEDSLRKLYSASHRKNNHSIIASSCTGTRVETKIFIVVFSRQFREENFRDRNFAKRNFTKSERIFAFREKGVFVSTLSGTGTDTGDFCLDSTFQIFRFLPRIRLPVL
jgi:hypothetical protein